MTEERAERMGAEDSAPLLSVKEILSRRSVPKARVRGWVAGKAGVGGIVFVILRDGTGYLQVSAKKGVADPHVIEGMRQVPRESVVSLMGQRGRTSALRAAWSWSRESSKSSRRRSPGR